MRTDCTSGWSAAEKKRKESIKNEKVAKKKYAEDMLEDEFLTIYDQ